MTKQTALWLVLSATLLGACATAPPVAQRPVVSDDDVRTARSHHGQGAAYLKEGKLALAIRELRAAAGLNPNDPWIRLALGEAYRLHGMMAEAIAEAQLLIDDPTYAKVWMPLVNKGFSQIRLGQLSDARKSLELAAEFKPDYWRAYLNLGILASLEGHRDEALRQFAKVIEHGAGTLGEAEANYRSAEIYVALGDQSQAIRHLLAATERNPEGQWGRASAEYLKRLE
jgi:tetratricopeptide (TPR) repeat protein